MTPEILRLTRESIRAAEARHYAAVANTYSPGSRAWVRRGESYFGPVTAVDASDDRVLVENDRGIRYWVHEYRLMPCAAT